MSTLRTLAAAVVTTALLSVALVATGPGRVARADLVPGLFPGQSGAQPSGGVLLDGWGGIHPFGGVGVNATNAPYWQGWDIARALVTLPDGSGGWTLDGWGGVHAFGAAPWLAGAPYWPGWDIARALVVLPNRSGGYVLDGWGGVHPFGSAPWLAGSPYWQGWDIARGLDIHYNGWGIPDGGWTLDGWGGIHPFGAAPSLPMHYFPGWDVFWKLHVVGGGAYLQARWGIVDTVGAPGGINVAGMPSWGGWDIVRDVVPVNPSGAWSPPPFDRSVAGPLMDSLQSADRTVRGLPALAGNGTIDGITGNGIGYNLAGCGGPNYWLGDRTYDLYFRNYFGHAIPGCAGTWYVFNTYYPSAGLGYRAAGENIAWRGGDVDLLDDTWATNALWESSPEHWTNITSTSYSQVGCGLFHTPSGAYQGFNGSVWIWGCAFRG